MSESEDIEVIAPEEAVKRDKLSKFLDDPQIQRQAAMWQKANGKAACPIFWDNERQCWWWANRKQLARIRKQNNK